MDLVDDHRLNGAEHGSQILSGEHQLKRLGCGDQKVRWTASLFGPLRLRGVTVTHVHAQADRFGQFLQATVNVAIEGPKRRDVENGQRRPIVGQTTVKQRKNARHGFA